MVEPGPLILAGGAEFDERMAVADRVWLALLGKSRPRLGLLPTANEARPELAAANGVGHFQSLASLAEAVMIIDPPSAADAGVIGQLERLDAAYMAGGSPLHLARTLAGSPAWEALARRWQGGMALGGSSAGAMVLCEQVFVRGQWAGGLGLVPGAVVLPHFDNREQAAVERVRAALTERGLSGIGIDESTAALWHGGRWWAAGPGRVVVLTRGGVSTYRNGEAIAGLPRPAPLG